tara:strand:- start:332 stop:457 length:126 start_codon:yes stop_codon:yes gene_type:complete
MTLLITNSMAVVKHVTLCIVGQIKKNGQKVGDQIINNKRRM